MLVDTINISTIHLCVNVETGDSGDPDLDVSRYRFYPDVA